MVCGEIRSLSFILTFIELKEGLRLNMTPQGDQVSNALIDLSANRNPVPPPEWFFFFCNPVK